MNHSDIGCIAYYVNVWLFYNTVITNYITSIYTCMCTCTCIYTCTCTYMDIVCYTCRIHMWSITDTLLSVHVYTHVRTCISYVILVEYTCGLLLIYF